MFHLIIITTITVNKSLTVQLIEFINQVVNKMAVNLQ